MSDKIAGLTDKKRIAEIIHILEKEYPDAKTSLDFRTPHELLVATILASQCTDERVNKVTETLFEKYPSIEAFAAANLNELEQDVYSTGFYRQKAKSIIGSSQAILTEFGGKVPDNMDDLLSLPGVGRKIANLVLGEVYHKPAVVVDTHVKRISRRLGFTKSTNPDIIERDLRAILPEDESLVYNHLLVYHGRAVCKAPKPLCSVCAINSLCPKII